MATKLRVGLLSWRPDLFTMLRAACERGGHRPVLCLMGRSRRPGGPPFDVIGTRTSDVLGAIPDDVDLLIPGSAVGLAAALAGYRVDVLVVCGLSWRLPRSVLDVPPLGVLNLHRSLLPRYRGPMAVPWGIRNGDSEMGITVHRMDERFDAGPILAQRAGIPLVEDVTSASLWPALLAPFEDALVEALVKVRDNDPGHLQDESLACYAPDMEPQFAFLDRTQPAATVHNQVRAFRFGMPLPGPFVVLDGAWHTVHRTRLTPGPGIRITCADGPLWIVDSKIAQPH